MKKKTSFEHRLYYFFIILVLATGITMVLRAETRQEQLVMIGLTVLSYSLIGIVHHFANHNLTVKIMVEYVLIGFLGFGFFFFLLGSIV